MPIRSCGRAVLASPLATRERRFTRGALLFNPIKTHEGSSVLVVWIFSPGVLGAPWTVRLRGSAGGGGVQCSA